MIRRKIYCVVNQTGNILTYSLNFSYFKIAIILYSVINSSSSQPLPCSSCLKSCSAFHSNVHSAAWISNSSSYGLNVNEKRCWSFSLYLMTENNFCRLFIIGLWVKSRDYHHNFVKLPVCFVLLFLCFGQVFNQTHQTFSSSGKVEKSRVDEPAKSTSTFYTLFKILLLSWW